MKLERNAAGSYGIGKYAVLKLRVWKAIHDHHDVAPKELERAIVLLEQAGMIDYGEAGTESEFFVIRLKDKYARAALLAYAQAAIQDDPEWAADVVELADRAGPSSPWCKRPD